jgi:hypothetical protein
MIGIEGKPRGGGVVAPLGIAENSPRSATISPTPEALRRDCRKCVFA